ncbi:hypothetical protein BH10ACI2_BH10ACI2_00590 [soil metagenome]
MSEIGLEIRVNIISPPDRKNLAAEIMLGDEQFAELNQEGTGLSLEIYSRRDGDPWILTYSEVIESLARAIERLVGKC